MYHYDPDFYRQCHRERVAELKADYEQPTQRVRPEPRVRMGLSRSIRLVWVSTLGARAVWLLALMAPIAVVAVGIKALFLS
jgi:hypothetical protein